MQYSKEKYSLWATAQSETKFEIIEKRGKDSKDRENATIRKTVKHKWLIRSQGELETNAEYRDIVSLSNKIS